MMLPMTAGTRRLPRRALALAVVALVPLGACGGPDEPSVEAAPTTAAPTTVAPPPTAAPTSTTTASTTTARRTTTTARATRASTTSTTAVEAPAEQATLPIVPSDLYADEPVIELGTIAIPRIGVDTTLYEGIRMTTLDRGPGHWPGSAMPGAAGNVVIGGHRTSHDQVFRDVDQLVSGDEIVFTDTSGDRHVYAVREVAIVQPTDVWIIDPTETPTATLFACHPPGSTAERIVVFADLVTG
jgi:sortase A